jgi:hypothetical protein
MAVPLTVHLHASSAGDLPRRSEGLYGSHCSKTINYAREYLCPWHRVGGVVGNRAVACSPGGVGRSGIGIGSGMVEQTRPFVGIGEARTIARLPATQPNALLTSPSRPLG